MTWDAPGNLSHSAPPVTSYEVECSGAGITTTSPCPQPDITDLTAATQAYTIEDLTPGSSYQVRVRAVNDEGAGAWSTSVRQLTSKAGNLIPVIDSSPTDLDSRREQSGRNIDTLRWNTE